MTSKLNAYTLYLTTKGKNMINTAYRYSGNGLTIEVIYHLDDDGCPFIDSAEQPEIHDGEIDIDELYLKDEAGDYSSLRTIIEGEIQ